MWPKAAGKNPERIREYTELPARDLIRLPRYANSITSDNLEGLVLFAALLHDVGKVSIEGSIRLKVDKLSPDENEKIRISTSPGQKSSEA